MLFEAIKNLEIILALNRASLMANFRGFLRPIISIFDSSPHQKSIIRDP
jgi:hypothetical protein